MTVWELKIYWNGKPVAALFETEALAKLAYEASTERLPSSKKPAFELQERRVLLRSCRLDL